MESITWYICSSIICSKCHVVMFTKRHAPIYLINFVYEHHNVSLDIYSVLILKFYTVLVRFYDAKIVVNKKVLTSKHVSIFFTAKI